ncbi:MAG TPA: aldo/keto reductase [Pseudomonadales bacterium]|nr:aldo/keto reductase [Pseudomonadales bacterium]
MEHRRLGRSGLKVSEVGVGCNNFGGRCDRAQTKAVVDAAIAAGVTLFDTADVYGNQQSEVLLGEALGKRRPQVVIATKFAMPMGQTVHDRGGSRRYILAAVEASLRRLGTDYIDLYQMHAPDPDTPIDETLDALDAVVRQGKVRYIGNSNFSGWQIADADWTARAAHRTPFVSAQNHYSLLERGVETEVLGACERFGLGMLPFFPLASGMLTGKYRRNEAPPPGTRLATVGRLAERALNERNFTIVEKLTDFAAQRDHKLIDVAFGWLLAKPVISSVIAGATSAEQVEANVAAATWRMSAEDVAAVDSIAKR